MNYLNIGCGNQYNKNWVNIDIVSNSKNVIKHDLTKSIPFENDSFQLVYSCHFIEHLSRPDALKILKECNRVLVKNGIIRIVVPDLEKLISNYLECLSELKKSNTNINQAKYDWAVIHLLDQSSRDKSGGEMINFINREDIANLDFITDRIGKKILGQRKTEKTQKLINNRSGNKRMNARKIMLNVREIIIKLILGKEYQALKVGRFRLSGETHKYMYDFLSLKRKLELCGYYKVKRFNAFQSYDKNWENHNLDTDSNKDIIRPDSLYIEALKA